MGWFNRTRLPNTELLCQCTASKRLITIASDWVENLSFLSRLPLPDEVDAGLEKDQVSAATLSVP